MADQHILKGEDTGSAGGYHPLPTTTSSTERPARKTSWKVCAAPLI
ncbi:hypothetical protein PACID_29760 [Acidipropionibacterium acidipropionici ATCC 4875]|uniref:Uncharacterized protein n=1 Tax=Acidipropionibacterium acidipropionici (strain ATCC 4875 / DSM 20272 / JCM 6432 / NBRC 12425 / NCIMB 8070 / 4) TaxID=1171373 RepID=K7RWE2_ACIA4|nr:hypothetical protein PACID_29760 [Acidipropionibacterium acidipropionici ATCC 4875]